MCHRGVLGNTVQGVRVSAIRLRSRFNGREYGMLHACLSYFIVAEIP